MTRFFILPAGVAAIAMLGSAAGNAGDSVKLDPSMMGNVHIETVKPETMHRVLAATGKVQFNDDHVIRVLAPMPGQIANFHLRVGDRVEKDQVVFSIKSREVASLVTDYLDSQRDQDLAEKTWNMTKDLYDHEAASRISLQQAETDLAKAKAHVARAAEALRVIGIDQKDVDAGRGMQALIPVHAAAGGIVIERTVTEGQFVQGDGTALLTIADPATVWVLADIFENDLHLIHPGQHAQITAVAYPNRQFSATVEWIGEKIDTDSRTMKVRLLVPNPDQLLKPEMFITAGFDLGGTASGLTIPAQAMIVEGTQGYAFLQTADRTFAKIPITATPDGPGRLRVTAGLKAGDRVVTDGALLVNFRQANQREEGGK
ncbi:MAG TPA: efflux RND transporter periplasmic adaptor subunit [Bryobacteraceae bacterium]|nr:efflux RND transporter periplasmic adaptor subunit [Bryobacteraceae bacterium]